jgi:hypothetical protein
MNAWLFIILRRPFSIGFWLWLDKCRRFQKGLAVLATYLSQWGKVRE